MSAGSGFDPATTQRAFFIASADSLAPTFLPEVIARVMAAGARIAVHVRPIDPAADIAQALDAGHIDLGVSNEPRQREDLRLGPLYSDEVLCILRAGHPLAQERRLSLARRCCPPAPTPS